MDIELFHSLIRDAYHLACNPGESLVLNDVASWLT